MLESGITLSFACALCGKRKVWTGCRFGSRIGIPDDWQEWDVPGEAQYFYTDDRAKRIRYSKLLFCSLGHATTYAVLEGEAQTAGREAFAEYIRQGQLAERSVVDALATVERDV